MEKQIKYNEISLIGMELFRKNNDTFMRSKLSPIMEKIFLSANKIYGITDYDDEFYMKSGILHNKVFYIYSNQLENTYKFYDVVDFNGEICIWFYSNNVINGIERDPFNTAYDIYDAIISHLKYRQNINIFDSTFIMKEKNIACTAMALGFIKFLHETYGVIDIKDCIKDLKRKFVDYSEESIQKFAEDILENCNNKDYYDSRKYLDSYLLLELDPKLKKILNKFDDIIDKMVDKNEESEIDS
jgi:hypothetical protein